MTDTPEQASRVGITPTHEITRLIKGIRDGKWPDLEGNASVFSPIGSPTSIFACSPRRWRLGPCNIGGSAS